MRVNWVVVHSSMSWQALSFQRNAMAGAAWHWHGVTELLSHGWRPAAAPRTSSTLSHQMRSHAAVSKSTRDNIGCLLQWQLEDEISGLKYAGNQRPNPAPRKFMGLLLPPAIVSGTTLPLLQHPILHLCCKEQPQLPSSLRYDEQASGHPSVPAQPCSCAETAPGTVPRSSLVTYPAPLLIL